MRIFSFKLQICGNRKYERVPLNYNNRDTEPKKKNPPVAVLSEILEMARKVTSSFTVRNSGNGKKSHQ